MPARVVHLPCVREGDVLRGQNIIDAEDPLDGDDHQDKHQHRPELGAAVAAPVGGAARERERAEEEPHHGAVEHVVPYAAVAGELRGVDVQEEPPVDQAGEEEEHHARGHDQRGDAGVGHAQDEHHAEVGGLHGVVGPNGGRLAPRGAVALDLLWPLAAAARDVEQGEEQQHGRGQARPGHDEVDEIGGHLRHRAGQDVQGLRGARQEKA
mmetsp:Transcript_41413/g.128736  ORF Transcript_41413/g.128736 Transcript_41413/m.128736 type:complete len:210 (-) Transcript_41413:185-814(-)